MYDQDKRAFVAISGEKEICLEPGMANRHGLITGATGTGKTVTLQTLAETFSEMGVPVFAADVKGDLSGVAAQGGNKDSVKQRVASYHLEEKGFRFRNFPVEFWDLYGEQGARIRATIADMGPLLLSRLLTLNDTQSDLMTILFKIAGDESWGLIDLKDLQKVVEYVRANPRDYMQSYGNISTASLGAIQRGLISLEQEGAGVFFGEPQVDIGDFMKQKDGKGVINILASDRLMNSPRLYTTFLLWLMNKMFLTLPEIGDPEKPRLVFFFDEAHLLFKDAPKALLETIEKVVRLIRSKGVGIFFISQTPSDIPDSVLGQLGNRVQHALRAYTARDLKALTAAARTFRANWAFATGKAVSELGTGEVLVSFLDPKGTPHPVDRAYVLPPEGQIGPLDEARRKEIMAASVLYRQYEKTVDRVSAAEILEEKRSRSQEREGEATRQKSDAKTLREEASRKKAEEKYERQEALERKRFWSRLIMAVVPFLRQLVMAMLKSGGKRK